MLFDDAMKQVKRKYSLSLIFPVALIFIFAVLLFPFIYLYIIKERIAFVVPVYDRKMCLQVFLPKGTYEICLLTDNARGIESQGITGEYTLDVANLEEYNTFFLKAPPFSEMEEDHEVAQRMTKNKPNTNLPYPWTHHIDGLYTIASIGRFYVYESSWIKIVIDFEISLKSMYLRIGSFIDAV